MAARKRKTVGEYIVERRARDGEFAEEFDKLQLARQMKELRRRRGLAKHSLRSAWGRRRPASRDSRAAGLRRGSTCCIGSRRRSGSACASSLIQPDPARGNRRVGSGGRREARDQRADVVPLEEARSSPRQTPGSSCTERCYCLTAGGDADSAPTYSVPST